jgi:acetylornithine/N-succinyldiaminopimelate aminotransferase
MTDAVTDTAQLLALGRDFYLPVYKPRQLILERGRGSRVWDREGREFVDLAAGIAVCGLGHNDPDLTAALVEQAGKLWHTSNVFYSEPPVRLAEELVSASRFAERAFLCNSGAEANEAAIKLVRKWATGQGRAADRASSSPSAAVSMAAPWPRLPRPRSRNTRKATSRCPAGSATSTSTTSPSSTRRWPAATSPR